MTTKLIRIIIPFLTLFFMLSAQAGHYYFGYDAKRANYFGTQYDNSPDGKYKKSVLASEFKVGHLWESNNRYHYGLEASATYTPTAKVDTTHISSHYVPFQRVFSFEKYNKTSKNYAANFNAVFDYHFTKRFHSSLLAGVDYQYNKVATHYYDQFIGKNIENRISPKAAVSLRYDIYDNVDLGITYHRLIKKGVLTQNSHMGLGLNYMFGKNRKIA